MVISLNDLYIRMMRLFHVHFGNEKSYNAMQCEATQSMFIKQHVIPVCVSEAMIRVGHPPDVIIMTTAQMEQQERGSSGLFA